MTVPGALDILASGILKRWMGMHHQMAIAIKHARLRGVRILHVPLASLLFVGKSFRYEE
ncbi:MAG: hypothetical protein QF579_06030 [Dehalococcoidia bacterium]|nr:hypothetical protein [Dehalococcoidia bacterium]